MKKQITVLVGFCLLCLLFATCQYQNTDPKPNPCLKLSPTSADFLIQEVLNDSLSTTDTTLAENRVRLTAKGDFDYYEWKIGNDPRMWNTKSVTLYFEYPESSIDVRLTVKKNKPDTQCFPNDKETDTAWRRLVVINKLQSKMIGNYEGFNLDEPNNPFTVSIGVFKDIDDGKSIRMHNLVKGCVDSNMVVSTTIADIGYKAIRYKREASVAKGAYDGGLTSVCPSMSGFLFLSPDGKQLTAKSRAGIPIGSGNIKQLTFKGQRK